MAQWKKRQKTARGGTVDRGGSRPRRCGGAQCTKKKLCSWRSGGRSGRRVVEMGSSAPVKRRCLVAGAHS